MFYPKADCCPFNTDEPTCTPIEESVSVNAQPMARKENMESSPDVNSQKELLEKIQEIGFAVVDLNLFLDTHPDCTQALELYTKLSSTLKSLKADYVAKYGPLCATDSDKNSPFAWVDDGHKWPWDI